MREALADRRRRQRHLIGVAREYVRRLAAELPVIAAAVVGSVARGDFNVWSDIDVVVVAEHLPQRAPDRGLLLAQYASPGVQAVGYLPAEFDAALARGNPLVLEAVEGGIILRGTEFFRRRRTQDVKAHRSD